MRAEFADRYKRNQNERIFDATQTRDVTLCTRGVRRRSTRKKKKKKKRQKKISRIHSVTARTRTEEPVLNAP